MRKLQFLVPLVLFAGIAGADTKADIQKVYNQVSAATLKLDGDGLVKVMMENSTKDFMYFVTGGKQNRTEFVSMMKAQMPSMKGVKRADLKIVSLKQTGNTAVVVVNSHYELTMVMPGSPKPQTIVSKQTTNDTWVKEGSKWKLKEMKVVKDNTTANGKPPKG